MAASSRAMLRDCILLQLPPTEQLSTIAAGAPGRLDGWSVRGRLLVAASDKEREVRASWRGGRLIATGDVLQNRVTSRRHSEVKWLCFDTHQRQWSAAAKWGFAKLCRKGAWLCT